jgi:hypothetical protein
VKQINYTGRNSLPGDLADGHVAMSIGNEMIENPGVDRGTGDPPPSWHRLGPVLGWR